MTSKMVLDRHRSASKVIQAAETQSKLVADRLRPILASVLGDDAEKVDTGLLLRAMSILLRDASARLLAADTAHETELADDAAPRVAGEAGVQLTGVAGSISGSTSGVQIAHLGDFSGEIAFRSPIWAI